MKLEDYFSEFESRNFIHVDDLTELRTESAEHCESVLALLTQFKELTKAAHQLINAWDHQTGEKPRMSMAYSVALRNMRKALQE